MIQVYVALSVKPIFIRMPIKVKNLLAWVLIPNIYLGSKKAPKVYAMQDKNGVHIKVNDKIEDKKGNIGRIENIIGVTFLVFRGINNRDIVKTIVFSKLNLKEWSKHE